MGEPLSSSFTLLPCVSNEHDSRMSPLRRSEATSCRRRPQSWILHQRHPKRQRPSDEVYLATRDYYFGLSTPFEKPKSLRMPPSPGQDTRRAFEPPTPAQDAGLDCFAPPQTRRRVSDSTAHSSSTSSFSPPPRRSHKVLYTSHNHVKGTDLLLEFTDAQKYSGTIVSTTNGVESRIATTRALRVPPRDVYCHFHKCSVPAEEDISDDEDSDDEDDDDVADQEDSDDL